jgi:hypothetical protein
MDVSLISQASEFALALLLGAGLGFVYDCMRIARGRIPLRGVTAALDLLFWATCAGASFWFAMGVGGGELRLFAMLAIALGIVAYFSLLSVFVRAVGFVIADGVIELFRVVFRPFFAVLKKIHKILIKTFSFFLKWRIMEAIRLKRKEGTDERGKEKRQGAPGQAGQAVHSRDFRRLRRRGDFQPLGPDNPAEGGNGGTAVPGGGAEAPQRGAGRGYRV